MLRTLVRAATVYYVPLRTDGSLPLSQKTGIYALSGAVFATISATYGSRNGPSAVVVASILLMTSFLLQCYFCAHLLDSSTALSISNVMNPSMTIAYTCVRLTPVHS